MFVGKTLLTPQTAMKIFYTSSCGLTRILFFASLIFASISQAQVGIGNISPDASSMLDITSTEKGILTPRMTTAQRTAIITPANSLLVYDTDLKSFYYYDFTSTSWVKINSGSNQRNNYKLVKSVADLAPELAAGGGTKYLLTSNTYYEINGTIALTASIDLNDAYISGLDANEDILSLPGGIIFKGSTGGSIRNVTLLGAKAFEITGPGISSSTSLLIQNTIVYGMTTSVGSISGIGLYFGNIIQFVNNTNGITYSNIGNLLLNNQAWTGTNSGTFEKLTGTFGLVQKNSGFSTVKNGATAFDVSANPTVTEGVIIGTVFSRPVGGTTGIFVNKYTTGSYTGYNFTNVWTVNCPGIPREADDEATGNLYFDSSSVVNITTNNAFKLPVTTTSIRNFRTSSNITNRVTYEGNKTRALNVFASISFTATGGSRYSFSIYKNGTLVPGTEAIYDVLQTNQRLTVSVIGTVDINPTQYIEIYVKKLTAGDEQFLTTSYNLLVN